MRQLKSPFLNKIYQTDLDQLSIFASMTTFLLYFQLKPLHFLSLLIRLFVYKTRGFSFGILIIFVNTFPFNLVVMFVYFAFVSSLMNLINLKQLVLL